MENILENNRLIIEDARKKHEQLREILQKYNNPEFGDCIVDEICTLFDRLTTIDTEPNN